MRRTKPRPIANARGFLRAREGATAVEFAILALPFLMLLFGIIELAMVFLVQLTLQNATMAASRDIRTGEFQNSGAVSKTAFRTLVCNGMSWLQSDCATKLTVDVQTFSTFTGLSGTAPRDTANVNANTTCWSPGGPSDKVLVRTYYEWKVFTPLLNQALVNKGADTRLISSATSFQNEPYSSQNPTGDAC